MTPLGQARLAARHLASSRRALGMIFPKLPEPELLRATIAAYNARIGLVAGQILAGRDVDEVTTIGPSGRGDYSTDVEKRANRLRIRAPEVFPAP